MKTRTLIALLAAAALAVPSAQAHRTGEQHSHGKGGSKSCKQLKRGFVVKGTLKAGGYTPDDPATETNEASISITVTGANRHARRSGELEDQNESRKGVQVKGGSYTVTGGDDAFRVRLVGYEAGEDPEAGDKVRVVGKIRYTKKRCAPEGTSTADRYGEPNVRKVKVKDAD